MSFVQIDGKAFRLSREAIDDSRALALASHAKWQSFHGHYENKYSTHYVGKLGEVATERLFLLAKKKHDSHFRNPFEEAYADLSLQLPYDAPLRIEVKTWRSHWYKDLGRAVSVNQIFNVAAKADICLWISAAEKEEDDWEVCFHGYSTIQEIKESPTITYNNLNSLQVDPSRLHPMKQLLEAETLQDVKQLQKLELRKVG